MRHIARIGEIRYGYIRLILVGKSERKNLVGKPRSMSKDHVKMYLKGSGCEKGEDPTALSCKHVLKFRLHKMRRLLWEAE
jgi:hypothetical protein